MDEDGEMWAQVTGGGEVFEGAQAAVPTRHANEAGAMDEKVENGVGRGINWRVGITDWDQETGEVGDESIDESAGRERTL